MSRVDGGGGSEYRLVWSSFEQLHSNVGSTMKEEKDEEEGRRNKEFKRTKIVRN